MVLFLRAGGNKLVSDSLGYYSVCVCVCACVCMCARVPVHMCMRERERENSGVNSINGYFQMSTALLSFKNTLLGFRVFFFFNLLGFLYLLHQIRGNHIFNGLQCCQITMNFSELSSVCRKKMHINHKLKNMKKRMDC